jgi:hypothetical protein
VTLAEPGLALAPLRPSRGASLTSQSRLQHCPPAAVDVDCGLETRPRRAVLAGLKDGRRQSESRLMPPPPVLDFSVLASATCLPLRAASMPGSASSVLARTAGPDVVQAHSSPPFSRPSVFPVTRLRLTAGPIGHGALGATFLRSRPMVALLRDVVPSSWTTRRASSRLGCPERPRLTLPFTCLAFRGLAVWLDHSGS